MRGGKRGRPEEERKEGKERGGGGYIREEISEWRRRKVGENGGAKENYGEWKRGRGGDGGGMWDMDGEREIKGEQWGGGGDLA
jgi:hypothetical protein